MNMGLDLTIIAGIATGWMPGIPGVDAVKFALPTKLRVFVEGKMPPCIEYIADLFYIAKC